MNTFEENIKAVDVIISDLKSERDSLKQAVALGEEISVKHAQFCEQLRAERDSLKSRLECANENISRKAVEIDSLKALVVRMREALSAYQIEVADSRCKLRINGVLVASHKTSLAGNPVESTAMIDADTENRQALSLVPEILDDAYVLVKREAVDNVRAALRLIVDTVATNSWGHYDLSSIKRTALEGIAALRPEAKGGA